MTDYQYAEAKIILFKLLESQPNLFTPTTKTGTGKAKAEFCIEFIETYVEWIAKQKK